MDHVIDRFLGLLVRQLPLLVGPSRADVMPLWTRACELYGALAAKRGLAAGEVMEEFHVLREVVIRDLYKSPPMGSADPMSLRLVLRLNRALDRGVTHASVGHTDAMFFQLLGAEERDAADPRSFADETEAQLAGIRTELTELLEHVAVSPS